MLDRQRENMRGGGKERRKGEESQTSRCPKQKGQHNLGREKIDKRGLRVED